MVQSLDQPNLSRGAIQVGSLFETGNRCKQVGAKRLAVAIYFAFTKGRLAAAAWAPCRIRPDILQLASKQNWVQIHALAGRRLRVIWGFLNESRFFLSWRKKQGLASIGFKFFSLCQLVLGTCWFPLRGVLQKLLQPFAQLVNAVRVC